MDCSEPRKPHAVPDHSRSIAAFTVVWPSHRCHATGWSNGRLPHDIQVFAKQFVEMGDPKPKVTIFVSQDDRALAASSFITGNVSRLGAIDPTSEPYRSRLEQSGITAIDLTKVKTGDGLHHGKFAESPDIVQLIGQRLMTGQPLTDSNVGVGEGVAAVVGGTVRTIGTVATAPLTLRADSALRRHRGDLQQTLRSSARDEPLSQ